MFQERKADTAGFQTTAVTATRSSYHSVHCTSDMTSRFYMWQNMELMLEINILHVRTLNASATYN